MSQTLFDVFCDGEKILGNVLAGRAAQQCGVTKNTIYKSCLEGRMIRDKYEIKSNQKFDEKSEYERKQCIDKFGQKLYDQWTELNKKYGKNYENGGE